MLLKSLFTLAGLFPPAYQEGFSAGIASVSASNQSRIIANWTVTSPYYVGNNFNATTGIYTVPKTGLYLINSMVSYSFDTPITTTITNAPYFSIQKAGSPSTNLLTGYLPTNNITILTVTLRSVLSSATVTLSDLITLTSGDSIQLYYNADSFAIQIALKNLTMSMIRVA